jgi:ATP-dependent Clp protease ATP-binding subunit ClpC
MAVWSPTAKTVVDRAQAIALERRARAGTLHLLAAVLETSSELARRLRARGVRTQDLRAAGRAHDEPDGLFDRVQSRARKLSDMTGSPDMLGTHLIAAALVEPRTALASWAATLGVEPVQLAEELVRECSVAPVVRAAPAVQAPARMAASGGGARVAPTVARSAPVTPTTTAPVKPAATAPALVPSVASRVKLSPLDARRVAPARTLIAAATANAATANATPALAPVASQPSPRANATRTSRPPREKPAPVSDSAVDPRTFPVVSGLIMARTCTDAAPVVGRERELERLRDALGRREGRGALLIGIPGSGRTAVLRAYAANAIKPVALIRHVELVARMRGPDGESVRGIVQELRRAGAVLALDPLAPWLLARDVPEDVQCDLRALLASGEVPWVAIATPEEARKLSETESWIDRAAVRVELDELPPAQVREVVRAHAEKLGEHHRVDVSAEVALRATDLADRYLGGRAQPDRTLAVLDLALSRARRKGAHTLDAQTVAHVVAELGAMPPSRIAATDHERLLALEDHLAGRVVGHRAALSRVAHVLRRNAVGFRGQRPVGTFLFLGPTGVGKTETAKAVAESLFPGVGAIARFDMAEYAEAHAVARLVGAPPGYVGYTDGGQLTEAVRRRPYQLVLLDEIEKAHRDVLEALLGLLDEGRLTDGRGRTVDFRHTVIVMTSNLGAELYRERATARSIGFGTANTHAALENAGSAVLAAARAALPPELWNRIDEPLVFGPLARAEVAEVARRMLASSFAKLSEEQGVFATASDSLVDLLLDDGGYDAALGARPMRRAIARLVEAPLAESVLRGELRRDDRVTLSAHDGALRIERPSHTR